MEQTGLHYLIDYYALLGVANDADQDAIRSAYRAQQLKYHPDRYAHLAPEFQAQAERRSRVITEAYETLSDAEKRAAYDAQVAGWEGPVSKDGTPIIDLSRPHFEPAALLGGGDEEARRQARELAVRFSGFDEKTFALLERLASAPGASPETVEAYKEALRRKSVCIELEESMLWECAGFKNRPLDGQAPRAYLPKVEGELVAAREKAGGIVASSLLALEGREVKMLGPGGTAETRPLDEKSMVIARDAALARFDATAEAIRAKARERAELIGKRLDLLAGEYRPEQPQKFPRLIIRVGADDKAVWFAFRLEDATVVTDDSVSADALPALADPDEARRWIGRGYNVLFLSLEEGIDLREQLEAAVLRHFESLPEKG